MNGPSVSIAEKLLTEASVRNPGVWVRHNEVTGKCAEIIAGKCEGMDSKVAYVLGLLHDVGRRFGVSDLNHTIRGYRYMIDQGYPDSARICLTHSFPYKHILSYNGENDCTDEDSTFIRNFIEETVYDDYDKLIQLCDALSYPEGPHIIEKRMVDVVLRKGFNDLTIGKWKALFNLYEYFESKSKENIYGLLGLERFTTG